MNLTMQLRSIAPVPVEGYLSLYAYVHSASRFGSSSPEAIPVADELRSILNDHEDTLLDLLHQVLDAVEEAPDAAIAVVDLPPDTARVVVRLDEALRVAERLDGLSPEPRHRDLLAHLAGHLTAA
jgi:alpha-ketoglutarate-dependent taurine dioxygenase